MPAGASSAVEYESLADTAEELDGMMYRLEEILEAPALTQDLFVEITAIYNNVAYVFLYLESNEAHVQYQSLLSRREAFYRNPELDARLLDHLSSLRCGEPDAEESRLAYITYLRGKLKVPDSASGRELEGLQAQAKSLLAEIEQEHRELVARLGVQTGGGRPAATFYKLLSTTSSAATRTRLNQVWTRTRDRNLSALVGIVDRMVDVRRQDAVAHGHASPLSGTLQLCRIGETAAAACLNRYLAQALRSHELLSEEVHRAMGSSGDAMDHFGAYVRTLLQGRRVPSFDLDECLSFAFLVAERTMGLTFARGAQSNPHVLTFDVQDGGRQCGRIKFDLWDSGAKPRSANTTRGIRNRTDWCGLVQQPVAYVSCRFRRSADGSSRINFQNVHSLFHEFGHAVNHLLIRKRLPNQSGLEYLPLERLESLSMWFEKWVYHPDFSEHLTLTVEGAEGLAVAQRVKMLESRRTHVDRAVTASLDFDVHRRLRGGLQDSFATLDEQFGISRYCSLGDFPEYFTWPMFQANPGANFAYLWGAADSAEKFAPFMGRRVDKILSPTPIRDLFSACFDYDEPSAEPNVDSVFDLYDNPLRSGRAMNS